MADRTESLKQELKLLREAYATRLPEKVGQVEEAWKELEAGRGDGETLKNLHFLVHRLTGSGATYGFVGLSEEARHLERYLKTLLESSLPFNQSQIAEANALIAKVKEAARQPELSNSANTPDLGQQISSSLNLPSEELPSRPILLIEGDQALAQDLALQIGNFGYAVHALSSLTELEKAVRKVGPAAIIAGIHFAGDTVLDGELLARIRQQNEVRIPFLFLSEEGDLTSRLQAVRVGGDAYFIKPVDVNALIDRLDLLTAYQTQEPYRVLIVEDDPALAAFYSLSLQESNITTEVVTDPMKIMEPLREFVPDLILMDIYMPSCSGLELAEVIRQQESYVSIPIVFLSSETSLDRQLDALRLGGDDFLTKPIRAEHLISSVSSRAQRSRILRSFMTRDSLTGLLNHTKTKEYLDIELARCMRRNAPLSFAMLDIDHFKAVNDTYGHPTGDRVIKSLSRLLQQRLRKTDIIGRYGGEEFAVVLLDADGKAALKVMEEIRTRFSQIRQHSDSADFSVTLSCGIASFPDFNDPVALNDAADKALYEAKRAGRNRVILTE